MNKRLNKQHIKEWKSKKLVPSIILTTVASTVLSGCTQFVPYEGKSLNPEARGITTVRSTPYGCKVLGEVEGKETTNPSTLYTKGSVPRETLRDSALNDLRNNAAEAIGKGKRITLRIVEEKPICSARCPLDEEGYAIESYITGYRISAQIFECGDKDIQENTSARPQKKK